jgi:ABC-type multidrug transport system fused ATPase/permease subunit
MITRSGQVKMQQLRRLFTYVKPYWKRMAVAAVSVTLWSLISLALPLTIRLLVD